MSHTEGQLSAKGNIISFKNGGDVCYINAGNYYADRDIATRIVATWNVCTGMTDELLDNLLEMGGEPVFEQGVYADLMEMERDEALKALESLLLYAENKTCTHDDTYRGGAIWEICNICGAKWADDEGGKPEWKEPQELTDAREIIEKHKELLSDE